MGSKRLFAAAAALLLVLAAGASHCTPKPGLLSVIGSAVPGVSHADHGAPSQMQGLALLHSDAEMGYCNIADDGAVDPLIASGAEIACYVYTNQSQAQWFYSKGIRHFVFGNEPDGDWGTYGAILQQAYPMFAAMLPGSTVIGGNCYTVSPYSGLYQYYNFKNTSDMVGFHNYSDDPATGMSIGSVISVHNTMNSYGDGSKKIYLGEGWGPKRELRTCPRISPDIPPSIQELQQMRDFVVNGWRNLTTPQPGYDPNWVYGALFFTLSDNWGFDYAHFYNGGIVDIYGNPKDDLLLLFPGDNLTLANCGFEYYNPGDPAGPAPFWHARSGTDDSCYAMDASIRWAGQRSQRVSIRGTPEAYVSQTTHPGSAAPGQNYTFAAWVKTDGVEGDDGVRLRIRFYDSGGVSLTSTYSSPLQGTNDWTHVTVTAAAPASASYMRVDCNVQGLTGTAWFDNCSVSEASSTQPGHMEGYVFDLENHTIPGATVVLDPGGYTAVSDSTGKFSITDIPAGVYSVTGIVSGYSEKTVSRVVAAPGRTGIAAVHLAPSDPNSPRCVEAAGVGVSGAVKISWQPPQTGADFYRVYRSTDPESLGALVIDGVQDLTVWDEDLTDYQTYYYTVRRVLAGSESTNEDNYSAVPTGGAQSVIYDNSAAPDWSNWASEHGQTFTATHSGSLISATCVPATAGEPRNRDITFSILQGGPTGPQVGPAKTVTCWSDEIGTALWSGGEVPLEAGQTYYLRLTASSGTAMYRSQQDVYAGGRYYMNGSPYNPSVDMWSTITMAESSAPDILNVHAAATGPGQVTITWNTTAPATSRVEYGPTDSYGFSSDYSGTLKDTHRVVLTGIAPGTYHYRAAITRPQSPNAYSLDYQFSVPVGVESVGHAKAQPDGTFLGFPAVVSAIFDGFYYVQNPDRSSGIRVEAVADGLGEGSEVYVTGTVETNADGERYVAGPVVTANGAAASAAPEPLGLKTAGVGGAETKHTEPVWSWQYVVQPDGTFEWEWLPLPGMAATGLLVRTWGRVTEANAADSCFYVDDGCNLMNYAKNHVGLKVWVDPVACEHGQFVDVEGVVSCFRDSATGNLLPRLLAKTVRGF